MKSIYLSVFLCFLVLLFSCEKELLYTEDTRTGKVTVIDPARDTSFAAANATVYMTNNPEDSLFYLYKTQTDQEGKFRFDYLPEKGDVYYYADLTLDNRKYRSNKIENSLDLEIYPVTAETSPIQRIQFAVSIDNNGSQEPVNGAQVCLFLNQIQSEMEGCGAAVASAVSDAAGEVIFKGLTLNSTYYYKASATVGETRYFTKGSLTYDTSVIFKSITLTPVIKPSLPKVTVLYGNEPIEGAQVCFFNNKLQRDSMSCSQSITTDTTGVNGSVVFPDIERNNIYYLKSGIRIGNTDYEAKDTVLFTDIYNEKQLHLQFKEQE